MGEQQRSDELYPAALVILSLVASGGSVWLRSVGRGPVCGNRENFLTTAPVATNSNPKSNAVVALFAKVKVNAAIAKIKQHT